MSSYRKSARILSVSALLQLHRGDLKGATEDIRTIMRLGTTPAQEKLLISQLVRIAVEAIGMNTTWQALQAPGWDARSLQRLQAAFEDGPVRDMLWSFETERAMYTIDFENLRSGLQWGEIRKDPLLFGGEKHPMKRFAWTWALYYHAWRWFWSDEDLLRSYQQTQQLLEAGRLAQRSRSWASAKPLLTQLDRSMDSVGRVDRFRYPFSTPGIPLSQCILSAVRAETFRAMTRTAIALKRYHLKHGAWPPSMDSLVPEYLPEPPVDWMDGHPLRYRLNPDASFTLYSVGEDFVDGGGDTGGAASVPANLWIWNSRDVVWPTPASKEEIEAFERGR
jgi:hypothetical protein